MSLLYTIVPAEDVWSDEAGDGPDAPSFYTTTWQGVSLVARRTAEGAVIERLLTTNPYLYLETGLQPGTPLPL